MVLFLNYVLSVLIHKISIIDYYFTIVNTKDPLPKADP